mmetsp:Transcript_6538/g.23504  ORF Transcript_6538/g.23504 Transcript_6538/m.23504 type:complete len:391 (-) Transcript_6538:701-1873(-)
MVRLALGGLDEPVHEVDLALDREVFEHGEQMVERLLELWTSTRDGPLRGVSVVGEPCGRPSSPHHVRVRRWHKDAKMPPALHHQPLKEALAVLVQSSLLGVFHKVFHSLCQFREHDVVEGLVPDLFCAFHEGVKRIVVHVAVVVLGENSHGQGVAQNPTCPCLPGEIGRHLVQRHAAHAVQDRELRAFLSELGLHPFQDVRGQPLVLVVQEEANPEVLAYLLVLWIQHFGQEPGSGLELLQVGEVVVTGIDPPTLPGPLHEAVQMEGKADLLVFEELSHHFDNGTLAEFVGVLDEVPQHPGGVPQPVLADSGQGREEELVAVQFRVVCVPVQARELRVEDQLVLEDPTGLVREPLLLAEEEEAGAHAVRRDLKDRDGVVGLLLSRTTAIM